MLIRDGGFPDKRAGARWSIDHWRSQHDAFGCLHQCLSQEEERWRIDIPNAAAIGWRNDSIGGPNGEQPSGSVWTLWGPDKKTLKCLPLGSVVPEFQFALFLDEHGTRYWENNLGRNFIIYLADSGQLDLW